MLIHFQKAKEKSVKVVEEELKETKSALMICKQVRHFVTVIYSVLKSRYLTQNEICSKFMLLNSELVFGIFGLKYCAKIFKL